MIERTFDRVARFDPRSLDYPIRGAAGPLRRSRIKWRNGPILDQGREGACVGHGWASEALAAPVAVDLTKAVRVPTQNPQALAFEVYRAAQHVDEWGGNDYSGTSVNAGAKVMREYGLLKEWRWCESPGDIRYAVLSTGPVVLGINWYSGMYQAPGGVLKISGSVVGGHCLDLIGYDPTAFDREAGFIVQNSWGEDWGNSGLAVISETDMARLKDENGDACVPLKRSYGRR